MRGDQAPWEVTILNALRAEGDGEADLSEIYRFIERQQHEFLLRTSQFEETRWAGRPMYQHTVRSIITNRSSGLMKRGLVERVGRGRYRLTDAGWALLKEWGVV